MCSQKFDSFNKPISSKAANICANRCANTKIAFFVCQGHEIIL